MENQGGLKLTGIETRKFRATKWIFHGPLCSPIRFSSRKSFHGIDRSNGHATAKPINLQIRCKMNYWSRFWRRSQLMRFTTQNVRNGTRVFLFLSKRTIFVQFLVAMILTIISKGRNFRISKDNRVLTFTFSFLLIDSFWKIDTRNTRNIFTRPSIYFIIICIFSQQRKIHFQLNFPSR